MSDINLVMRMTKEHQPRLGITVGCILALACLSTQPAKAQIVQAAGENQSEVLGISALGTSAQLISGDSGRLSSRRVLVNLPQQGEASPSDTANADDAEVQQQEAEEADAKTDKQDASKGITPVQSAGLRLSIDPVNIATTTIGTGVLPEDMAAKRAAPTSALLDGQARGIVAQQVNWRPAAICHLPLYFEDAMLERHGHVRWGHAQPIVSGAKFLATMPLLPYIKTLHPPLEPRYTLGHFRPGSCAPALKDHLPWDRRAAAVEVVSLQAFFWAAPL
ncbi:MAG: hypothetical protein SFV81_16880 [Pirellulaceae bacterium]|nr:hypothetical protein [Pirellulaceae bacterium]